MNGYVCFYNGKRIEVYAADLYAAKKDAVQQLKVPMSKWNLVSIVLAEKNGAPVVQEGAAL